ncbi:MAG: 4Fe-4S dicluster domain-containing protein [Bacteroidetes bacterium]|nr:4Fe-4S dicluster domain-containing protein [Bacteroidota bacterium]
MFKLKYLKQIRRVVSLLVIISIVTFFLSSGSSFIQKAGDLFIGLQIFPALLKILAISSITAIIIVFLILLVTVLFGRVYCSSICPMGILQDVFSFISLKLRSKKKRRFKFSSDRKRILKYSILGITILFWIFGSLFLINFLDPYSNFGKITTTLIQPAYIYLNNFLAFSLERFEIYSVAPLEVKSLPLYVVLVSTFILLLVGFLSIWRGRLFCNTICPVGALLSVFSERSLFKISISESDCTMCGKCERVCKAECIDSNNKLIDHGRCVSCFNCFDSCSNNGFYYRFIGNDKKALNAHGEIDKNKRSFMLALSAGLISIPLLNKKSSFGIGTSKPGIIPTGTNLPITPPGSLSIENFTNHCIACYLCVSKCPKNVIVPSFFDYGLEGFMQPKLDFTKSYCNFDCVECSKVCPTGAVQAQKIEDKKLIQLGVAKFIVENCVVMVSRTDCGACSEHCPTKAVNMVPFEGLWLPEVNPDICIGCGACEYACPTSPYKAIFIESNEVHKKALPISDDKGPKKIQEQDFPF